MYVICVCVCKGVDLGTGSRAFHIPIKYSTLVVADYNDNTFYNWKLNKK